MWLLCRVFVRSRWWGCRLCLPGEAWGWAGFKFVCRQRPRTGRHLGLRRLEDGGVRSHAACCPLSPFAARSSHGASGDAASEGTSLRNPPAVIRRGAGASSSAVPSAGLRLRVVVGALRRVPGGTAPLWVRSRCKPSRREGLGKRGEALASSVVWGRFMP